MRKYSIDLPALGTLRDLVRYVARRYGDATAFVFQQGNTPQACGEDETKSFRAFSEDIDALGTTMFHQGLRDCRVAVLGGNSYEWIVSYFAIANGGNAVVPLDRDLPAADLAPLLENSGCAALIYAAEYEDMLPLFQSGNGPRRYIRMDEIGAMIAEGRRLIESGGEAYTGCPLAPDSLAAIVYTSGTTGKSKGVMLTHGNMTADALSICRMSGGAGSCVLTLPLHHTFGLLGGVIIPLLFGVGDYISASIRNTQKDMAKTRATVMFFVPAFMEVLYKKIWESAEETGRAGKLRTGLKLSRALLKLGIDVRRKLFKDVLDVLGGGLNLIVCGGAPLSERIVSDFRAMGVDVLNGYGITECSPVVSVNPNYPKNRIGSVGKPLDCCRVRIDAPDENGVGEIQVKGDNVMVGYYGDVEATAAAFTGSGWFKTGDLGYLDKAGYLYVTGRIKHLIILSNGKNVSPEELEEKIKRLPGVLETAVYGADDKIVAEIYADGEAGPQAEETIRAAVSAMNRELPHYKQIGVVNFRGTEFPKTTTMKIKKHSL